MTTSNPVLAQQLRRIADGPSGPTIGAFFDYDGTLIDGYSAAAYFIDRIKRGDKDNSFLGRDVV